MTKPDAASTVLKADVQGNSHAPAIPQGIPPGTALIYAFNDLNGTIEVSTDKGKTFLSKALPPYPAGLPWTPVPGGAGHFTFSGNEIYAPGFSGLYVSHDQGATFAVKTYADGLGGPAIFGVAILNNVIFAATTSGLSVSRDGGASFATKKISNDLLNTAEVDGVQVVNGRLYAALYPHVSESVSYLWMSSDEGQTFTPVANYSPILFDNIQENRGTAFVSYAPLSASGQITSPGTISLDAGATFRPLNIKADQSLNWHACSVQGAVFVFSDNAIYVSNDDAATFTKLETSADVAHMQGWTCTVKL